MGGQGTGSPSLSPAMVKASQPLPKLDTNFSVVAFFGMGEYFSHPIVALTVCLYLCHSARLSLSAH